LRSSACCYDEARGTTKDAPELRSCPIIRDFCGIFICFQPHINIIAFIRRLRNQNWLFHPTIADLIEEDHICRLVDDVVENIDFKSIEEKYDGPGSPAYHPKVMMKLLIQSGMHST
jgi:hypothetical protein